MADTRQEILAVARDLLLDGGLTALSMRKVAARCGISAPAIYRHFSDKDALVASAVGEAFGLFMKYLSAALAQAEPLARFRRLSMEYFAFAGEQPRYYQLIFMTNCDDLGYERLDEVTRERGRGTFRMLVDRIAECQREGLFKPGSAERQALFAWSSYHGLVALRLTGNLGPDAPNAQSAQNARQRAQIEGVVTALAQSDVWSTLPAAVPWFAR